MTSANVTANLTREETAERAATIALRAVRVELDLTGAPAQARTGFSTTTTLTFDATAPETWIDFIGESVTRVVVNDKEREVRYDGARILIDGLAERNIVRVEGVAAYSRSGEG